MSQDELRVERNDAESRYEGWVGDELAGFAEYQLTERLIVFTHTVVEDRFEGRGIGSAIVRFALDDACGDGTRKVVPVCPFVKKWFDRHTECADLLFAPRESTARD